MEVVVTTGAISRAKLQSNHHHQQTNIQFLLQAGCPSCCPTNSVKALKGKYHIPWTCLPQAHLGVFQLCLWPLIAPSYLGGGLPCLSSALWCQYPIMWCNTSVMQCQSVYRIDSCWIIMILFHYCRHHAGDFVIELVFVGGLVPMFLLSRITQKSWETFYDEMVWIDTGSPWDKLSCMILLGDTRYGLIQTAFGIFGWTAPGIVQEIAIYCL